MRFEVGMWYNQTCMFKSSTLEKDKPVRMHSISGKRSSNRNGGAVCNSQSIRRYLELRWKVLGSDEEIGVGTEEVALNVMNVRLLARAIWDESGRQEEKPRFILGPACKRYHSKMKFQTYSAPLGAGLYPWHEFKWILPSFQAAYVAALFLRILLWQVSNI